MQQRLSYQQKIEIYSMKRQSENQCFMIYKVAKIGYLEIRKTWVSSTSRNLWVSEICNKYGYFEIPKNPGYFVLLKSGYLRYPKNLGSSTQFAWVSSNTVANWALGKYPTLGS